MGIEPVGDVCAVRTVLVVNVARDRRLWGFVAGIAVVVVAKALVCMRAVDEATGVHGLLLSRSRAGLSDRRDASDRKGLLGCSQTT